MIIIRPTKKLDHLNRDGFTTILVDRGILRLIGKIDRHRLSLDLPSLIGIGQTTIGVERDRTTQHHTPIEHFSDQIDQLLRAIDRVWFSSSRCISSMFSLLVVSDSNHSRRRIDRRESSSMTLSSRCLVRSCTSALCVFILSPKK